MTESPLTARSEQVLALALERERAKLVRSLCSLTERTRSLGEAQAEEFSAGSAPAAGPLDLAEQAVELTLARVEQARLALVDAALRRLAERRYGTCDECGHPIGLPRLYALPWARRCRRCVERSPPEPNGVVPLAIRSGDHAPPGLAAPGSGASA
jgi:RNA polymerase-binding transcription factor DksA